MESREAIKWLELLKQKNIEFDDYSEDTREIREEATRRFQKALSLGIQALENQKSIIEELEKLKDDIKQASYDRLDGFNGGQIVVDWDDIEDMFYDHISKLKGERK